MMMGGLLLLITLLCLGLSTFVRTSDTKDIVVIVLSQENEYHVKLAEKLRDDLQEQADNLQQPHPLVHLSHQDFPHVGAWTILPLISSLSDYLHKMNSSWLVFVEDRTRIRLRLLLDTLSRYNPEADVWVGCALHDNDATIIHHFAFYEDPTFFQYPNLASGFFISTTLLTRLADRIKQQHNDNNYNLPASDFAIDNAHELALFIWNKGDGLMLENENTLCVKDEPHCATFPIAFKSCSDLISKKSIYFAVKTCEKFHKTRLPVVKETWGRYAEKINFFSDVKDDSIPTISLDLPNTEHGHCAKTVRILKYIYETEIMMLPSNIEWIVLADDDTILGVAKIQQLLTCYNASESVVIGERYGYNVRYSNGYNYITGGGGTVFSRVVLSRLVQSGVCECPADNTPDDMYLGMCLARMGVSVTHSPLFHQARPVDYPSEYLDTNDAVSFHKHWMIDPISVYDKWFAAADLQVSENEMKHDEL